jgi:tetratricopeptide (TPR) repeat protein
MPELLLLAAALAGAGAFVVIALRRPADGSGAEPDPAAARYRVALETLRDVEADHRSGLLDDASYERERAGAEATAAEALRGLEPAGIPPQQPGRPTTPGRARRMALVAAAGIGSVLLVASALPGPLGLASRTVVDERLAVARAEEQVRQERIDELGAILREDPQDRAALSDLADAYLAGESSEDLARAAAALLLLISLDPEDEGAYRRIISAYIQAGDYADAASALASFEEVASEPADVAFFRGLLALRADDDPATAEREFRRFLELAPDDDRAPMVRALRAEAARATRDR